MLLTNKDTDTHQSPNASNLFLAIPSFATIISSLILFIYVFQHKLFYDNICAFSYKYEKEMWEYCCN